MEYVHIADRLELINYWIGLALNLLLVHLILRVTRPDIGSYKYLQLTFVLNDIAYASYSYVMQEKMMTKGHAFAMFLIAPYGNNVHFVCLYGAMFSLILVIVSFNFLYRYWALINPQRIQLFSTAWFPLLLAFLTLTEFAVWYASCFFLFAATDVSRADLATELAQKYGLNATTHALIIGDYWRDGHFNWRPITGLAVFCGIISAGFAFMVFCTVSILRNLSQAKVMSAKTKKMQYALFRLLAVQTLIPVIFVHADAGQVLILPLFGVNLGLLCDWCSMIISFFAPLDALAVLLLMREYRKAIKNAVLCRGPAATVSSVSSSVHAIASTTKIQANTQRQSLQ